MWVGVAEPSEVGQKHVGAGALTRPGGASSANWCLCKTSRAALARPDEASGPTRASKYETIEKGVGHALSALYHHRSVSDVPFYCCLRATNSRRLSGDSQRRCLHRPVLRQRRS